jgi:hypothetical protein
VAVHAAHDDEIGAVTDAFEAHHVVRNARPEVGHHEAELFQIKLQEDQIPGM